MLLDGLFTMVKRMKSMAMGSNREASCSVMIPGYAHPRRFQVAFGRLLMMSGRLLMMTGGILVVHMTVVLVGHGMLLKKLLQLDI